jgi:capsular exopolysaccharide synthesis family protein
MFEVDNLFGLTSVLTKKKTIQTAAQTSVYNENLYVLPSGPIPPNPSELLGSNTMKEFINQVQEEFDIVLFDAPPVLAVADASILGKEVDGTLLVAKSHSTEKDQLIKAKKLLEQTINNVLGVVMNGKDKKDSQYYYYYGR